MTNFKRHFGALAAGIATAALVAGAALADPAVIYDEGGKFDHSFNEATFNGAQKFKDETGVNFGEFETTADPQREQALRQFASKGYSPIVAPGFSFETALRAVAPDFPDTQFVIIDSNVDLPNVRSYVFKEQEGSYLVGIMAAMASKSGTIGVVPAFNFDLLEAFACGYKQGAKSVNPDIKVLENYISTGFDGFTDLGKATEVATTQISQGSDVEFAVAGAAGNGILQAATDAGVLAIGVDSNQNYMHPGNMLTSMTKRVDLATYNALMDAKNGKFTPGLITLGVAEDGVGPAFDEYNKDLVTPEMQAAVDDAHAKIASGEIKVHDFREDKACPVE